MCASVALAGQAPVVVRSEGPGPWEIGETLAHGQPTPQLLRCPAGPTSAFTVLTWNTLAPVYFRQAFSDWLPNLSESRKVTSTKACRMHIMMPLRSTCTQTRRHTDTRTRRHTDTRTHRHTNKHTNKQREREREKDIYIYISVYVSLVVLMLIYSYIHVLMHLMWRSKRDPVIEAFLLLSARYIAFFMKMDASCSPLDPTTIPYFSPPLELSHWLLHHGSALNPKP